MVDGIHSQVALHTKHENNHNARTSPFSDTKNNFAEKIFSPLFSRCTIIMHQPERYYASVAWLNMRHLISEAWSWTKKLQFKIAIKFRDPVSMQQRAQIKRIDLFLYRGWAQRIAGRSRDSFLLVPHFLPQIMLTSFLMISPPLHWLMYLEFLAVLINYKFCIWITNRRRWHRPVNSVCWGPKK